MPDLRMWVCDCDSWEGSSHAGLGVGSVVATAGPGSSFDLACLVGLDVKLDDAYRMTAGEAGSGTDSHYWQRLPDPDQHTFAPDDAAAADYCVIGITWKDWKGISFSFSAAGAEGQQQREDEEEDQQKRDSWIASWMPAVGDDDDDPDSCLKQEEEKELMTW